MKKYLCFMIMLFLVGCADLPAGTVSNPQYTATWVTMSPTPPNPAEIEFYSNQATAAANNAVIAQLTAQAVAVQATRYYEQQTAQAQYATSVAISAATGTAVALHTEMTAVSSQINSQSTQMASLAQATETARANIILSTLESAAAAGTAEAIMLAGEAERNIADMHIKQLEQELEYQRQAAARNNILFGAGVLVVSLVALLIYSYFQKRSQPHIIQTQQGPPIVLVHTPQGLLPVRTGGLSGVPVTRNSNTLSLPAPRIVDAKPRSMSPVGEALNGRTASWSQFTQWDKTDSIPIGVTTNGPVVVDFYNNPHLIIAGATGTGKTRSMLWPIVATVAYDAYVLLVNERGNDFSPFRNHPNVEIVRGNRDEIPNIVHNLLQSAVEEMDRRDAILQRENVSTWSRLPNHEQLGSEIVIVIDEFLAIARSRSATPDVMKAMFDSIIILTSEGRKFGMRFIVTATSPSRRALGDEGMIMRDQLSRISFRLKDKAVSHGFLGHEMAALLPEDQFVADVGKQGVVQGLAFRPSEEQIIELLAKRGHRAVLRPSWLNTSADIPEPEPADPLEHPKADEIIELFERNPTISQRQIEMEVFGYNGGEAYRTVSTILKSKRSNINA